MTRERRHFPRAAQPFEARYRLAGELQVLWSRASVINVSASGARIRSEEPIAVGSAVELELKLPGQQSPTLLRGHVVWDHLEAAGVMEHGIEFTEATPTQRMQIDEVVRFVRVRDASRGMPA